jgi:catechol 2,3-dioxygenase-like lactoylglutathione lyase family enzyme
VARQWQVTAFQRLVIFFAGVAAIFLAAMTAGGGSVWLLVAAAAVLAGTVAAVVTTATRRGLNHHEIVMALVLAASAPPPNADIKARCDMRVQVHLPGRGRVQARLRDPAMPLSSWPQPGRMFPVEVVGGNPHRRMRIRWDKVEQGVGRAPGPARADGPDVPVWEDDDRPVVYSPTPPRPRRPQATAQVAPAPPASLDGLPEVHLYEQFTDVDGTPTGNPPDTSANGEAAQQPGPRQLPPALAGERVDPNGHDPDGYDPADFEEPRLEAMPVLDFDPAEVDIRDFGAEPPAVTMTSYDDEPAGPATGQPPATSIPMPRSAEPPPGVDPPGAAPGGTGLDVELPVSDLARSLRFYHDDLGLTIAYRSSRSAVVEGEGARILLQQLGDPAHGQAPGTAVHLQVTDIEATCAALRDRGVTFVEPPAEVNDTQRLRLWRARLRDPDGHDIAIIEWRPGT